MVPASRSSVGITTTTGTFITSLTHASLLVEGRTSVAESGFVVAVTNSRVLDDGCEVLVFTNSTWLLVADEVTAFGLLLIGMTNRSQIRTPTTPDVIVTQTVT